MQISNEVTFPIFTFISAGIVNVFVPSGGGQWGVQGPIIIEAASKLNVPYWKAVMALAYGDQITNMLQPFWALPLLGITGLKAKRFYLTPTIVANWFVNFYHWIVDFLALTSKASLSALPSNTNANTNNIIATPGITAR